MKKVIATFIGLLACFAFGYLWKDIRNNQFPGSSRDYLLGIRTSGKNVRTKGTEICCDGRARGFPW
jgi:hypothetical protein